jgi:hypothetical protein
MSPGGLKPQKNHEGGFKLGRKPLTYNAPLANTIRFFKGNFLKKTRSLELSAKLNEEVSGH